jgi:hypothetical protein
MIVWQDAQAFIDCNPSKFSFVGSGANRAIFFCDGPFFIIFFSPFFLLSLVVVFSVADVFEGIDPMEPPETPIDESAWKVFTKFIKENSFRKSGSFGFAELIRSKCSKLHVGFLLFLLMCGPPLLKLDE